MPACCCRGNTDLSMDLVCRYSVFYASNRTGQLDRKPMNIDERLT